MDRVHAATRMASTSSLQSSSMLIHHSRDSAKKQWAETQVITLHGTGEMSAYKEEGREKERGRKGKRKGGRERERGKEGERNEEAREGGRDREREGGTERGRKGGKKE